MDFLAPRKDGNDIEDIAPSSIRFKTSEVLFGHRVKETEAGGKISDPRYHSLDFE